MLVSSTFRPSLLSFKRLISSSDRICKDNTKQFCPSCGNATLLRASVTISSPNGDSSAPAMQVHLKPNFQYRSRGTKYSIPLPKPGSAKHGPGEGLILREDQAEYMRAKKLADKKAEREEKKMLKGMMGRDGIGSGAKIGSWMDPDWIPDIMSTGGRKGKSVGKCSDLPVIGYGKKNPNERRRKK
jgi:RNA-binding protein NOB1